MYSAMTTALDAPREAAGHEQLGPAGHEAHDRSPGVPGVDVLASGLGQRRRHLREHQRAQARHDAAQHPHGQDEPGVAQVSGDEPGRAQDARADDDADGDGHAVADAQDAMEAAW